MAIWLMILVMVVLFLIYKYSRVEGFSEFKDSAMEFGNRQNTYFHDQITKGILTNPGLNLSGLDDAVAQPDLYLPSSPPDDMSRFFMEDPENAFTEQDNAMCRGALKPSDLPIRKPGDRIGCGWYFQESNDKMSIGALGTRNGPVITTDLVGGTWIWNRERAIMMEDMKRCKALKTCEMLEFGDAYRECGFCFEKGHGIPIKSDGTPKYSTNEDGKCGSRIVRKAEDCKPPALAGTATAAAGELPSAGPVNEAAAGADPCVNNGIVTVSCLLNHINFYGFDSNKGGLGRLIVNPTPSTMTAAALRTLSEAGQNLPEAFWKTRTLNGVTTGTSVIAQISALSRRIDGTNESRAARFLVDGTPFTPCDSYTGGKTGPFDIECLQQAYRKAGCQAGGASYPNPRTAVSEFANKTWSEVNSSFKRIYDDMKSSDPRTQDMALKNCLGVGAEFGRDRGSTCWKCEDGINTPLRRNATGDIECASIDGINCLWQTNKNDCDRTIAAMPKDIKPLACGADHKAKYGGDGYSTPAHWCARAEAGGKHNGPLSK